MTHFDDTKIATIESCKPNTRRFPYMPRALIGETAWWLIDTPCILLYCNRMQIDSTSSEGENSEHNFATFSAVPLCGQGISLVN